jgi:ABC-type cobalamin/Fe3+-siderophores transport system ATPase subunit
MATHALQHPLYFESEGVACQAVMLCKDKEIRKGKPGELITPETLLEVYGVRAAVCEIKGEEGKTVRTVAVLGSDF